MINNKIKYEYLEEGFSKEGTIIVKTAVIFNGSALFNRYRFGVLNRLGVEVIEVKYEYLVRFENGFICENDNHKYFLIDKNGKKLCDTEFDFVGLFKDGIAKVKIGWGWSFIDKNGKLLCEAKYSMVYDFHDSLALVEETADNCLIFKFLDTNGKVRSESVCCRQDDKVRGMISQGLYEIEVKMIDAPNHMIYINSQGVLFDSIYDLYEDRRLVREAYSYKRPSPYKWGYLNSEGRIVIPCEFAIGTSFLNGKALVTKLNEIGRKQNFFIDKNGVEIRKIGEYDLTIQFKDGLSWVKKDNLWGLINQDGDEICKPQYIEYKDFCNDIAIVRNSEYYYGFINSEGNEIMDFKYIDIQDFKNGAAIAKINGIDNQFCFVLISESGQELTSQSYLSIDEFENGYAKVMNNREKYGFINRSGEEKIPCKYNHTVTINKKRTLEVCVNYLENKWIEWDLNGNFIRIFHPESYWEEKPYTYKDSVRDAYGDIG